MASDLDRNLEIYTEHILATIGHPQVLEAWIKSGHAQVRVREVLQLFYDLGKESKHYEEFNSKENYGCCSAGSEDSSGAARRAHEGACDGGSKEEATKGQEEAGKETGGQGCS